MLGFSVVWPCWHSETHLEKTDSVSSCTTPGLHYIPCAGIQNNTHDSTEGAVNKWITLDVRNMF